VGTLRQRVASSEAKVSEPSSGAAKWMSDPDMAEYMRHAAAEKIKSLYAPLFQELKLTPDQQEKFGELLANQATNFFGKLSAASQGSLDPAGAAPNAAAAASDLPGQLRSLLGDAGIARFAESRVAPPWGCLTHNWNPTP
jgi:hypothetical protein